MGQIRNLEDKVKKIVGRRKEIKFLMTTEIPNTTFYDIVLMGRENKNLYCMMGDKKSVTLPIYVLGQFMDTYKLISHYKHLPKFVSKLI